MPTFHQRLIHVRCLSGSLRNAALAASLAHASTDEADAIVADMLEAGISGSDARTPEHVLACWRTLSPHARAAALACARTGIAPIIAALAKDDDPGRRLSAAMLVEHRAAIADAATLIESAALLARDSHAEVRAAARDALAAVALAARPLGPDDESALDAALAAQLHAWDTHRHEGVIRAAVVRAPCATGDLVSWLAAEGEAGHFALRSIARAMPLDPAREAAQLLRWCGIPALAGIALDRLRTGAAAGRLGPIIANAHLLALRRRARPLRRVPSPAALVPAPGAVPDAPAMTVRWITALPLRPQQQLRHLGSRLTDPSPVARLMAVRAIDRLPASPAADEALTDFTLDPSPEVAAAAASALAGARSPSRRAAQHQRLEMLTRSPHHHVRRLVADALNDIDPWRAPASGDQRWWRPVGAWRELRVRRDDLLAQIRDRVRQGERRSRLDTLTIAQRLGMARELVADLRQLVGDADPFIAARACILLGRADAVDAAPPLVLALAHADARIRASAVESLSRLRVELPQASHIWSDRSHRVRACGAAGDLRAHPRSTHARQLILDLIADAEPAARAAGLWAVARAGFTPMLDHVERLRKADPDQGVRARAAGVAHRLGIDLRAGWARHEPAVTTRTIRPALREGAVA